MIINNQLEKQDLITNNLLMKMVLIINNQLVKLDLITISQFMLQITIIEVEITEDNIKRSLIKTDIM